MIVTSCLAFLDYVNTDLTLSLPNQARKRNKLENIDIDRLSNLPDSLIHHILSLLDTKSAVQYSIISKTWRNHWQNTTSLDFDHANFQTRTGFGKFVRHVLRFRRPFKLSKLRFYSGYKRNLSLIDATFKYAKSHGVEELGTDLSDFPPSFLDCQTLKSLTVGPLTRSLYCVIRSHPPNSFTFSSLTTLQLYYVSFDFENGYDFFSSFFNLEKLLIIDCFLLRFMVFKISAPRLVNLTISNLRFFTDHTELVISSPKLRFFSFEGIYPLLPLNVEDCPILEMVKICLYCPNFEEENTYYYNGYLISASEKLSHASSCNILLNFPHQPTLFTLERYSHSRFIKITKVEKEGGCIFYYYMNPSLFNIGRGT
ncbi:F-box protein [Melia azedarach]|uniref:F-box protein n=1 Tax=Melia azedarach TaxID=155640 RepID=A0ACC1Z322_MELAZ|nr:F-box protein [Melia azedarach]